MEVRLVPLVLVSPCPHLAEVAVAEARPLDTVAAAAAEEQELLERLEVAIRQGLVAAPTSKALPQAIALEDVEQSDSILEMGKARSSEAGVVLPQATQVVVLSSVAEAEEQLGVRGVSMPMEAAVLEAVVAQARLPGLLVLLVAMVAVMRLVREVAVVLGQVAPQMEAQAVRQVVAEGQAAAMMEALGQVGPGVSAVLAQSESIVGR